MLGYASALVSSFSNVRARRVPKKNASPPLPFTLPSLNRVTPLCPGLSPQHMAACSHSLYYARNKNAIPAMLGGVGSHGTSRPARRAGDVVLYCTKPEQLLFTVLSSRCIHSMAYSFCQL